MKNRQLLYAKNTPQHYQGGVVLVIVLVLLVAMMLGGISLLRSVDVSTLLAGNLGFKRDTVNYANWGFNNAARDMQLEAFLDNTDNEKGCPASCDKTAEWKSWNFWPVMLQTDKNGIPVLLKDVTAFESVFPVRIPSKDGNTVHYLIERMCPKYGAAQKESCIFGDGTMDSMGRNGSEGETGYGLPVFRVTVRTDGPRGTVTYTQAIIDLNDPKI